MHLRIPASAALVGFTLACAGVDPSGLVGGGPPRGATAFEAPEPEVSVLALPVLVPYDTLEAAVQDRLPELLVDEEIDTGKNVRVDLTVRRPMAVRFASHEGDLRMTIPLAIEADLVRKRAAARRERLGKEPPKDATLTAGLELDVVTSYRLDADWKLVPDVTVTPRWTAPAILAVGPLKVDVTERVEEKLAAKLVETEAQIEARMAERSDLRPRIQAAWEGLATPKPAEAGAWLVVDPVALHATAPVATSEGLQLDVGVSGRFRIVPTKPEDSPIPPLPPPSPPTGSGLHLSMVAELGWDGLEAKAMESLGDATWPFSAPGVADAGQVVLRGIELYPSGEHLVVGLEYATESTVWDTSGTLWLLAVPELGPDRTIVLHDFDYAVESDDWTGAPVNAELIRDQIRGTVEGGLVFPYGDTLDARVAELNGKLAAMPLERGGQLAATLSSVLVEDVVLTDAGLGVRVTADGAAAIELTSLDR